MMKTTIYSLAIKAIGKLESRGYGHPESCEAIESLFRAAEDAGIIQTPDDTLLHASDAEAIAFVLSRAGAAGLDFGYWDELSEIHR